MSARILRDRQEAAAAAVRRLGMPGENGSEAVLVQTKAVATYPTIASAFFACTPLQVDGSEVEGTGVTFVPDASRTIFAYNLGTKIPPVGTRLIAHSCSGRWTFLFNG